MEKAKKIMLHPFTACMKLMSSKDFKRMDFNEQLSLFFIDISLMPLLVFENYLVNFSCSINQASINREPSLDDLRKVAMASDFMSLGDNI